MKKAFFAFLTFLQVSMIACADENTLQGPYVGGIVGIDWANQHRVDYNNGYMLGAVAGYKFASSYNPYLNARVEAEISYKHNGLRNVKFNSQKARAHGFSDAVSYMANVYYDIETGTQWTPYLGFGLGCVHTKEKAKFNHNSNSHTWHDNRFATQYMGGVDYEIGCGTKVGAEYRYKHVNDYANEHILAMTMKQYF